MTNKQKIKASKYLSYLLRHKPEAGNLTLDANGWANSRDVLRALAAEGHPATMTILREIVTTDDKSRYAFRGNDESIRANQGHSLPVDLGLVVQPPPERLYHGTAETTLRLIWQHGLLPMRRQHVHLSSDVATAITVGTRHGTSTVLEVRANDMAEQGHPFYRSENGVWLTTHVPLEFLQLI